MKKNITILLLLSSCVAFAQFNPPATKKTPTTDTYFGKQVTDNYRWLENINDSNVLGWFKAQGSFTESIMSKIPERDSLVNAWLALDKLSALQRYNFSMENNRYFYLLKRPGEKVGKLYYRDGKTGKEMLLFDPATYAGDKNKTYSISYFTPNDQGNKIAIGISEGGAEVATIKILNVDTKKWSNESIYPSWFGVSGWTQDGNSFLYTLQKTGDQSASDFLLDTKTMLHKVGTDPKTDMEIFSRSKYPDLGTKPEDLIFVNYSEDRKYIIAFLSGVQNELHCFYAPSSELMNNQINWKKFFVRDDDVTNFSIYNDKLYLLSHKDAPNYKILMTDMNNIDVANAKVIQAEGKLKIDAMGRSKDYLFITLTNGINTQLWQYDLRNGTMGEIKFPQPGNSYISPYNYQSNEAIAGNASWNLPNTYYDYNADTKQLVKSVFQVDVKYPGLENIAVKEVEVPSYDGAMVPLSIIYRKDLKMNGSNCCIMEGYGAYGVSYSPFFSKMQLVLENKGVVIAFAHVRGGGEKGETWYKGGYKTTKPNTWKDFIACGEYLVNQGYTSPQKLSGTGTSAGGILIGRAITERPDLFGAAICNVGCANAIRMETTPNGPNNTKEFGISTDSVECMALLEMDAFLHVKDGVKYPAIMCATGMNDPRVPPWEPGKFAAALQGASASGKPVLLRVDYDNGHFTEDRMVTYKNFADQWSFLLWQTGHPDFQMNVQR